jgi:hypothetical protein
MASLQRKALSQAGRGSTPGGGSDSESGGEDDNGGSDGEDSSGDGRPKKEEDMDVVELWALNVGILNTVGELVTCNISNTCNISKGNKDSVRTAA